ncbi:hypothetical protein H6F86_31080 [Phormidium sp. FACHB-592]|uniref:Uncharacterized protein n=1 Tax=Stenomitos frigidus AS-A4 TaxID=2933935 RepID=A0ABV0KVI9_9CYAN|nr:MULTISPECIES: hypothetical protein [Cyanophyceae]MBD2034501.1 hypothetical protein [Leptolyngbya sp. FACHB-321]MBD2078255.1 hypothetical protein [Phormidium sp. FACHB-592]
MHILQFTLCYPLGECHPDALLDMPPDDVELSGNYELYEFQTAAQVPAVGKGWDFPESGGRWVITKVESYAPTVPNTIDGFHTVLCTRDGVLLDRKDSDTDYRVLGLRLDGDTIYEREPGLADWWVSSALSLPKPSNEQTIHLFQPVEGRPACGYDLVAIVQTQGSTVTA